MFDDPVDDVEVDPMRKIDGLYLVSFPSKNPLSNILCMMLSTAILEGAAT